jgi:hypothetical protein
MLHAHRGPVSGLTHIHLLRESAEVRAARAAEQGTAAASVELQEAAKERSLDTGRWQPGRPDLALGARLADGF